MKLRNRIVRRSGWTFEYIAELTFVEFFDALRTEDEPDGNPVLDFAQLAAPELRSRARDREMAVTYG